MTIKTAELITAEDKRNKQCGVCGESYRDTTRPNNKKTCSAECAKIRKNERHREDYRLINPPKPNQRQLNYNKHSEYPFWLDERIMRNQTWKHEVPYEMEDIENISAAISRNEHMGGRKKPKETTTYDGDEKGKHGVTVKYANHTDKKAGEVVVTKMKRKDMEQYLADQYSN